MRQYYTMRVLIGSLAGTALAFTILKIGDAVNPTFIKPSLLFIGGLDFWVAGMVWWMSAGLAIGICAAAATIRLDEVNTLHFNALSALLSVIELVALSSYLRFGLSGVPLTWLAYLQAYLLNLIFFLFLALFPILLGILLGRLVFSLFNQRRSAMAIMPDELRERYQNAQAKRKQTPLLQRVIDRTKKTA
jgi:hypothetical protein